MSQFSTFPSSSPPTQTLSQGRTHRSSCNRRLGARVGSRAGATTVEFAIIVPIIFALFLGTIEMTRLNFIRHSAANAAYEGARKGIIPGNSSTEATDEAMRLMQAVGVSNGVGASISVNTETVTVTVNVPVNQNSWGIARFSSGMTITQSCTLTKETPR